MIAVAQELQTWGQMLKCCLRGQGCQESDQLSSTDEFAVGIKLLQIGVPDMKILACAVFETETGNHLGFRTID